MLSAFSGNVAADCTKVPQGFFGDSFTFPSRREQETWYKVPSVFQGKFSDTFNGDEYQHQIPLLRNKDCHCACIIHLICKNHSLYAEKHFIFQHTTEHEAPDLRFKVGTLQL